MPEAGVVPLNHHVTWHFVIFPVNAVAYYVSINLTSHPGFQFLDGAFPSL